MFSVLSELFSVVCCVLNVPGNLFSFAPCYIFESANVRHWPGGDSNISPFLVNIASIFCLNFLSISISQIFPGVKSFFLNWEFKLQRFLPFNLVADTMLVQL